MNLELNTLSFTLNAGVGHLVMKQPPGNRMTMEFFAELGKMIEEMKNLEAMQALVISGEGRHYSSGAALDELLGTIETETNKDQQSGDSLVASLNKNQEHFRFFGEVNIPVISAIRGACLGSAFELALFSHFRFCGEDAVMGLPESTFGLLPGIGGTGNIRQLAGKAMAIELALTGQTFGAEKAFQWGLADAIVPKKSVVEFSLQFADKIKNQYRKEKKALYLERMQPESIET
jgi:enoyl-CoA hydratase/carnithine racemase